MGRGQVAHGQTHLECTLYPRHFEHLASKEGESEIQKIGCTKFWIIQTMMSYRNGNLLKEINCFILIMSRRCDVKHYVWNLLNHRIKVIGSTIFISWKQLEQRTQIPQISSVPNWYIKADVQDKNNMPPGHKYLQIFHIIKKRQT